MHGIVRPQPDETTERRDWAEIARRWGWKHRFFLLLVVLPTALVAAYYYGVASDQYESEANFVVRSSDPVKPSASGLSSLLSGSGVTPNQADTMSVIAYLQSTEATMAVENSVGLTKRFHSSSIDSLSRLRPAAPSPETLRKYYNKQAKLKFDKDTGITRLAVHAFTPEDAYQLAANMLTLGEKRVNELNRDSYRDALSGANRQLSEAETELRDVQVQMTSFRRSRGDIDPEASGKAQLTMVTQVDASLAAARAQLEAMNGIISPNSPQYVATRARVRALSAEVAGLGSRLAGQGKTNTLGDYESLRVRQDFAVKRYDIAAAAYQAAREDARRKQLYLVRVVNPNVPVKALYPERARIVLTVLASLLVAYGIGSVLAAGLKEHTNG